jgi:hypothetical protein
MRIENIKNIVIEDIPMGKPPPGINMTKVLLGLLAILKIEEDGMLMKLEDGMVL